MIYSKILSKDAATRVRCWKMLRIIGAILYKRHWLSRQLPGFANPLAFGTELYQQLEVVYNEILLTYKYAVRHPFDDEAKLEGKVKALRDLLDIVKDAGPAEDQVKFRPTWNKLNEELAKLEVHGKNICSPSG